MSAGATHSFTDQLELHILELSKFNKGVDELLSPLDRWLFFLRHGEDIDAQDVPESLDVPEVRWALGDRYMISRADPEREFYQAQLKARRHAAAKREYIREGSLAEGRAEMRRISLQSLQELLGQSVTPLEDLQTLAWDDLESMWGGFKIACMRS